MFGYVRPVRAELKGKDFDLFPLCRERSWMYEEAYPVKPFWWLYGKLGRRGERQK